MILNIIPRIIDYNKNQFFRCGDDIQFFFALTVIIGIDLIHGWGFLALCVFKEEKQREQKNNKIS